MYAAKEASAFQEVNYEYYLTKKHVTEHILPLNAGTLRISNSVKVNTLITHPINFIAWYAPGPLSGDGQCLYT